MRHTTPSFISFSFYLNIGLFFFPSLFPSLPPFLSILLLHEHPPQLLYPLSLFSQGTSWETGLGIQDDAHNHMLDIFMGGVSVYVKKKKEGKKAGGGVCLLVEMYYSVIAK